jgi:hypothetical protein
MRGPLILLVLLVCSCAVSCLYPGSPISLSQVIHTKPVEYYSSLIGSKWVYEEEGEPGSTRLDVSTAVTECDRAKYVTIMFEKKGKLVPSEEIKVSPEGVFRVGNVGKKLQFPTCLLKLPCRVEETWENDVSEVQSPLMKEGCNEVMTNKGLEIISVPAGVYCAMRVDCVDPINNSCVMAGWFSGKSTTWFAPEIGIVKQKIDSHVWVLKSFSPGQKASQ